MKEYKYYLLDGLPCKVSFDIISQVPSDAFYYFNGNIFEINPIDVIFNGIIITKNEFLKSIVKGGVSHETDSFSKRYNK